MISPVHAEAPIGVFDSGLGGLTVLRQIQRLLPSEAILYFADTAHVPYGDKPLEVVRDLALALTDRLILSGAKLVIMASGTSTVAGLEAAQERYPDFPIFGTIEAGARTAIAATSGPIGVLATDATARTLAFTQALQRLSPGHAVVEQGCPLFVPLVESGRAETLDAEDAARQYLAPLAEAGVEAIILGCTHFPFLLPALRKVIIADYPHVRPLFVDPAEEAVHESLAYLTAHHLLAPTAAEARQDVCFAATGDPGEFRQFASGLLGKPIPPVSSFTL